MRSNLTVGPHGHSPRCLLLWDLVSYEQN
jgi:hypothetical protein